MAEPTTSTTVAITASAGLVSLLPFVNGDALFGAVIGAAFLAYTQVSLSYGKRIFSLMLSVALGYALAPENFKPNWCEQSHCHCLLYQHVCLACFGEGHEMGEQVNID